MKKANAFYIANKTDRLIVFGPKDPVFREENTWSARPQTFIFVDYYLMKNMETDLDEWVFYFFDDQIEMNVDDIAEHGVELNYWLVDPKLKEKGLS